jgi:large subunit ribosomal protein L35Ae
MSQQMYGRIINYRIGIRTQMSKECLIEFAKPNPEAPAQKLIGQKVLWKSGKNEHMGKIVGFHGKNGIVKVKFKKGLPGQALGTQVELIL